MPFQNFMKTSLLCVVSALLASCQAGTVYDKHTGNTIVFSERVQINGGLLHSLNARAVHSQRKGYGIAIEYMNTGLGWAFLEQAWSFGRQLEYDVGNRTVLGCGGGCSIEETGAIRLNEQDFRQAAVHGFEFKLIGRADSIEAKMPASAFRQVLGQMSGAGAPIGPARPTGLR